jgi:hypothetical protein
VVGPPAGAARDLAAATTSVYRYSGLFVRRSLRTRYLWRLIPVLLVLGLLLGVAMTLALPQGARPVWLAAAAGAAGASLSGLLRFRDEVRLGSQVRAGVADLPPASLSDDPARAVRASRRRGRCGWRRCGCGRRPC